MDPLTILTLASGLVGLLEQVIPDLRKAFASGTITPEQQKELKDRIDALSGSEAFSGPEWEIKD